MQRLKERLPVWAPFYTLHKIVAGMLVMHEHCGDERALEIALAMVAWARKWTDGLSDEEMSRILQVEYGGMNEVLYNLHALTGDPGHAIWRIASTMPGSSTRWPRDATSCRGTTRTPSSRSS
jgi:hypothetical protein